MLEPRPTSAADAVARCKRLLVEPTNAVTGYALGTGDYRPRMVGGNLIDRPWTEREEDHAIGCDCAGLVCWAYKIPRHRPGYNRRGGYDVEDDLNCNSMLGDAFGARDCFELATGAPLAGDVIAYPSFYLYDANGQRLQHDGNDMHWIGHTCVVIGVTRVASWDWKHPRWDQLDVLQVRGGDGRTPAAIATDGSIWLGHDHTWPKDQHRSWLIRAVP